MPKKTGTAACKRTATPETADARKARLDRRRALSRTGDTTFLPMRNKRVDGLIEAEILRCGDPHQARINVARMLPARSGDRYRVRPSKNNDPVYRKDIVPVVKPKRIRKAKAA